MSQLPFAPSRYFEQNLSVNKTTTFLKDLLEAMHASSHSVNLFLLKLGTFRSNKAMHYQAVHFGVYLHPSELALPTSCWKGAKENYLACHISSLATASQEEGLKLNGNENKIQPSDLSHCVSSTTQSTWQLQTSQAEDDLSWSPWLCGREFSWSSFIKLYCFLSTEEAWYTRCFTAS